MRTRLFFAGSLLLVLAALLFATDTTMVTAEGNLNLSRDTVQRGDLIVLAGNVMVPAGARIDGSLVVLCCNVAFDGELAGDLYLVSGNIRLGSSAVVNGEVGTLSANSDMAAGAVVAGERAGLGLVLTLFRAFVLVPALALAGVVLLAVGLWRGRAVVAEAALR